MAVLEVKKETFENEVLKATTPCLVDFYADWCGPCKMLAPIVEEVSSINPDVKFCKLNIDQCPELAMEYHIMTIPALVLFKNGEVADRTIGVISKSEMIEFANQ
ncbi:MAG: thioredoxin [Eubacteriales bacterium]|nr:thioredoxin [Lachnospiraceae bacterium]MDO5128184.1 thioredoxin [Eubacteriales bacterium]